MTTKNKKSSNKLQNKTLTLALAAAFLSTNFAWGMSSLNQSTQQRQLEVYLSQTYQEEVQSEELKQKNQNDYSSIKSPEDCIQLYEQACVNNRGKGIVQKTNCKQIESVCQQINSQQK